MRATPGERVDREPDPDDPHSEALRPGTDTGDLLTRTIIIAGGHGVFEPKKAPGHDITPVGGQGRPVSSDYGIGVRR